jgi:hypothetical protein
LSFAKIVNACNFNELHLHRFPPNVWDGCHACALAALARAGLVLMEAALRQQLLALYVNGRVLGAAPSIGCSGVALRRL